MVQIIGFLVVLVVSASSVSFLLYICLIQFRRMEDLSLNLMYLLKPIGKDFSYATDEYYFLKNKEFEFLL